MQSLETHLYYIHIQLEDSSETEKNKDIYNGRKYEKLKNNYD